MILVYQAGKQLVKVRALMLLSLVCFLTCLWWAFDLARTYGLNEGDRGALAPLPERLALGSLVAFFGAALTAGMWLYGSLYATRIEVDPTGERIHLDTVGFFGNKHHVINFADVERIHSNSNLGFMDNALDELRAWLAVFGHTSPVANAPWTSVRVAGWRLPLIIDQQGVVLRREFARYLFSHRGVVGSGNANCDSNSA